MKAVVTDIVIVHLKLHTIWQLDEDLQKAVEKVQMTGEKVILDKGSSFFRISKKTTES